MRHIFTISILLLFVADTFAQSFEWVKGRETNYEMNPDMLNYTVSTSPDGTIWLGGMNHLVQFYNVAMGDQFLLQFDANGSLLNDYIFTGSAVLFDMEADETGDIYITGQYISDLHFWDGYELEFTGPSINSFFAKIASGGTVEWALNLSTLFPDAVSEDIAIHNGHIYLAHSEWSASAISEFDGQGNLLHTIIQDGVNMVTGIAIDPLGNTYATGSCASSGSKFGGISYPSPFPYSTYLVKYEPQGTPAWVKYVEDVTCTSPKIEIDGDGNIIWAGDLFMETSFDTIALLGPTWLYDLFVTKFNPEGHALWGFEVPQVLTGDARPGRYKPFSIMPDQSISLAGFTRRTIDWGNGVISNPDGEYDVALVLNISSAGVPSWVKTGGGEGYDNAFSIDLDPAGDLYIAGIGHETIQFDTCSYTGTSYYYPYLAKIKTGSFTNIATQKVASSFSVFPNPTKDQFTVTTKMHGNVSLEMFDISGQRVLRIENAKAITPIKTENFPSGIYELRFSSDKSTEVQKLVIL